ncbi:MAG TPA: ATP-dependent RNA helicase HrpA, partial [Methylococcaceae bacterium]|nr:ATP-dependent RNA helicase HrpA [Methylococcaceae bacterium]
MTLDLKGLKNRLDACYRRDQFRLRRAIEKLEGDLKNGHDIQQAAEALAERFESSVARVQTRMRQVPKIEYPDLPVSDKRAEILQAILSHQVVIVCGETGSGKTTQLPKICLEAGRGMKGMIGHTQPRRIAARTVATRIAEELGQSIGQAVGYKVRFRDKTSSDGFIKLMTDGILLAEIQHDRFLDDYDTLIIDEAHERSLNIDFLLGYLRWVLPKRPDLKVIITSAT